MARLFDADAFIEKSFERMREIQKEYGSSYEDGYGMCIDDMKEAPPIDVESVKQDWTSVEDELPKHTGRYLVYDESGNCYDAGFDEDIGEKGEFGEWRERFDPYTLGVVDSEWISYGEITHWMSLPEFPIRKDGE